MTEDDRLRVLALLRVHGWNATSFQVLEEGFRYLFVDDDACVAYVDTGRAWVAGGGPIAATERLADVTARFVAEARRSGRRACFFAVERRFVDHADVDSVPVGEQPVWDPRRWPEALAGARSLREQLRRARAKGVTVRAVPPSRMDDPQSPERRAAEALIRQWLGSRAMAPMGFLVDVQPFGFAGERRYYLAEQEARAVAFLAAVPVYARQGWFFEDLLREPTAPNGTAELLVDAAMRDLAPSSTYATLGLAPLAGDVGRGLRLARATSRALYDFEGVRAFKAKLRPHGWEPILLAYPRGASPQVALYDVLVAFANGSFTRFGIESLLRGPALVVRVLAALLVPWTVLLAFAGAQWFPFGWVKPAWIAFDAVLAVALFALAQRWRRPLGVALAWAVTVDAVLTVGEALVFNVPRLVEGRDPPGDVFAVAVACLAPGVAAAVLWGAVGHRRGEPNPAG